MDKKFAPTSVEGQRRSRLLRLLITLALGYGAAEFAPGHACRLRSPLLEVLLFVVCFMGLPALAYAITHPKAAMAIVIGSPFITFGAMLLYVEVLHWERFPSCLLVTDCLSEMRQCQANLKQLEGAKASWALEHDKTTNDTPTWAEIIGRTN